MRRMDDQRGFSLLEVMASIALLGIVTAALAVGTVGTIKSDTRSNYISTASALVQDKIEAFRALDPATNPADLTAGSHTDPNNPITPTGLTGGTFTRSWVVTANSPSSGLSTVAVTVSWTIGGSQSVVGVTYVCRTQTCS